MSQILLATYPSGGPPSPQTFTWVSNGDTNDALYFIGRDYGVSAWTNPDTAGRIVVSRSSSLVGTNAEIVDRAVNYNTTDNNPNEFIKIDLGAANTLVTSDYSIRNGNDGVGSTLAIRNWRLRGSNDDSTWFDLDIREPDNSMGPNQGDWIHLICSESDPTPYRYIQLYNTGPNSGSLNFLQICEIQLYGILQF